MHFLFLALFTLLAVIFATLYVLCYQARQRVKAAERPKIVKSTKPKKQFPDTIICNRYDLKPFESKEEKYKRVNINGWDIDMPLHRPVRVYCDGIYDLFHSGHALSLKQAKELFPNTVVVVGVCNDEITHKLKGKTVMSDDERYEAVSHCRYADEVVTNAPWVTTPEFLEKHKIDFVIHGEDPTFDENGVDTYKWVKEQRKFITIKRTDGISTTDLIMRIVKEYDAYVYRNLKRGYSRKEMNVSLFKEAELKVEAKLEEFQKTLLKLEHKSEDTIMKFLTKFNKKSPNDVTTSDEEGHH